jgi:polyhydroxybutyrate depolymerase
MRRLLITLSTFAAGAALLAECATGHDAPARTTAASARTPAAVSVAGPGPHDLRLGARTYRLYVPAGLPATRAPLVVALHAALGAGGVMELLTRLDRVADKEKLLVAYPDGAPATGRVWNAGDCCNRSTSDDAGFLGGLIDHLVATQRADAARVYVTGISNGAMMAYRMACQRADKIAAVAAVAGSMTYRPCRPARPVPLMIFHGSADTTVPEGGGSLPDLGMRGTFPAQDEVVRTWSRLDGVSPPGRVAYRKGGVTCRAAERSGTWWSTAGSRAAGTPGLAAPPCRWPVRPARTSTQPRPCGTSSPPTPLIRAHPKNRTRRVSPAR